MSGERASLKKDSVLKFNQSATNTSLDYDDAYRNLYYPRYLHNNLEFTTIDGIVNTNENTTTEIDIITRVDDIIQINSHLPCIRLLYDVRSDV